MARLPISSALEIISGREPRSPLEAGWKSPSGVPKADSVCRLVFMEGGREGMRMGAEREDGEWLWVRLRSSLSAFPGSGRGSVRAAKGGVAAAAARTAVEPPEEPPSSRFSSPLSQVVEGKVREE